MIHVSLLDDHPVVLEGIQRMLSNHPDITLLPLFRDPRSLILYLEKRTPDVLLLDLILPEMDPIGFTTNLKEQFPAMKILILTNLNQPYMAQSLFDLGVDGYLLKDSDRHIIIEAILSVHAGNRFLDPVLKHQMEKEQLTISGTYAILTERERQMLQLIADEYTNKEIAQRLHLSPKRTEAIRQDLYLKLEVSNIAGLVRKAIAIGFINNK